MQPVRQLVFEQLYFPESRSVFHFRNLKPEQCCAKHDRRVPDCRRSEELVCLQQVHLWLPPTLKDRLQLHKHPENGSVFHSADGHFFQQCLFFQGLQPYEFDVQQLARSILVCETFCNKNRLAASVPKNR